MVDFNQAFAKSMGHEGGYANDPDDAGGETYRGIARNFHPKWAGWPYIDKIKEDHPSDFVQVLNDIAKDDGHYISGLVKNFYEDKFWEPIGCHLMTDQNVAEELFDTGINMGVGRAVQFLQEALNALNRNQKDYGDISVDGAFGKNTLKALQAFQNQRDSSVLFKVLNILQGSFYIDIMKRKPSQEKYAYGWFNRVTFIK